MKWLVGLLLLVNALLLGYFQLAMPTHVEAPVSQDIDPAKIKVLSEEELAAMAKPAPPVVAAPVTPPAQNCYEWGSFAATDALHAKQALDQLALDVTVRKRTPQEAIRYWVYIPSLKSPEAAQIKVGELKQLGIDEVYIVQDPKWKNAISLGLFRDEGLATKFLEDLRSRGVRSAIKGQRNHEGEQTGYLVKNVTPLQLEALGKLNPDFPGSELKPVDCN